MEKTITLAGGCFWGPQAFYDRFPGVIKTTVGYAQGCEPQISYQQVCSGMTDFVEAVEIVYDSQKVTLAKILDAFFESIDASAINRQGPDWGRQYRTGIYYDPKTKDEDLPIIHKLIKAEQFKYHQPIATEVEALSNFVPAEEYHQKYLDKNPLRPCHWGPKRK